VASAGIGERRVFVFVEYAQARIEETVHHHDFGEPAKACSTASGVKRHPGGASESSHPSSGMLHQPPIGVVCRPALAPPRHPH
jgi:hypothetical protein